MRLKLVCVSIQTNRKSVLEEGFEKELYDSSTLGPNSIRVDFITDDFQSEGIQLEHGRGKFLNLNLPFLYKLDYVFCDLTNVYIAFFIYQSTFGGASPNEGQVMFDTSSFLNWWFGGKKSSGILAANGKETSIDNKLDSQRHLTTELTAVPTASVGIEHTYENSKNNLINKSSATIVSRSSIDTPFIAGYMDFDPMVAATRIHSTSAHHRGRRASWFNRSD